MEEIDLRLGRINFYISPKKLYEETGYIWKGEKIMNYAVLCKDEKEKLDRFYETVHTLEPILVNQKLKKIIFSGDVYTFVNKDFFNRYLKRDFHGETMNVKCFYEIVGILFMRKRGYY